MQSNLRAVGKHCRRRGVATLWLIIFLPVFLILLCVVVEIGNLWWARLELETAMEAAALATVKEWSENVDFNSTPAQKTAARAAARAFGVDYAAANTVRGSAVTISDNGTAATPTNPNGNDLCVGSTANLILGSVSLTEPYAFDANVEPDCGQFAALGNVDLDIEINTNPGGGTSTNYGNIDAYSVTFTQTSGAPLHITRVVYDLQTDATDNGVFHVDNSKPTSPPAEGAGDGWGPFPDPANSFSGTFLPDGSTSGQESSTLQIDFAAGVFATGGVYRFGVDTDRVANGTADTGDTSDPGGDFNNLSTAFSVTLTFSNGSDTVDLVLWNDVSSPDPFNGGGGRTFTPPGLNKNLEVLLPPTGSFGVRAQATKSVTPVCSLLCNFPIGPFSVAAHADALAECTTVGAPAAAPHLIRVNSFNCTP